MRKLLALSVTLFLVLGAESNAQVNSGWQWMHPKPQGNDIRFIKMNTATNWVSVGYNGTMMRTTNTGASWLVYSNYFGSDPAYFLGQGKNIYGGEFADANVGVVCGGQGWISRTTNGGASWDSIGSSAGTTALWKASFGDASTVYIGGNSGLVLKSTNAGVNWVSVASPSGGSNRTVFALDANTVFTGSLNGTIYKSTNGGTSWTPMVTGSTTSIIFGIYFFNANAGIVSGEWGYVRYTTNGGASWNIPGVSTTATETRLYARKSPDEVYLLGDVSSIYRSTDYGATWSAIPYQYPGQEVGRESNSMDIKGSSWVVGGENGLLNVSTNAGATWAGISKVLTSDGVYGLDVVQGTSKVWVSGVSSSGLNNSILFSSNSGTSWSIQSTIPNADLRDIDMISENSGWSCGFNGAVFRTSNGGVNWGQASLPGVGGATLTRVDFVDDMNGYIFAGSAAFWKTTDGGNNWAQMPTGTGEGVRWADMVNAATGYHISSSITDSRIFKTSNGGTNWTEQSYPNPGNLWRIKMINSNTGYVCGDGGRLFRTTDGLTWVTVAPPAIHNYTTTDWYDINNGVLGAGSGFAARTTNGGQSWFVGNTGGYTVWTMKMIHPDTIWSTQDFGLVFKYVGGPTTDLIEWKDEVPASFVLKQNYPNPFNPSTTIEFSITKAASVNLTVFDMRGREVRTLINNMQLNAGVVKVAFDGTGLSSGVYFYAVAFDGQRVGINKMVLLK